MEEGYVVYYCSVCYVCKKLAESSGSMKFCSGCKLIQYCSTEHQKQDWPNHRELCKAIQLILKKRKMSHVYQDASIIPPEDHFGWNSLRSSLAVFLELSLGRRLTSIEAQMVLFPPVCSYCHLYKVNRMFICPSCKSVMFCCKTHQNEDKKHQSVCKFLSQSFEADMLRCREQSTMIDFLRFVNQCRVDKFPEDMETFIKAVTPLTTIGMCHTDPLSYTLTLVHVINNIVKVTANQLTIHVVGSDNMEFLAVQTFPLIYHLLPHVIHLKIVLIGPIITQYDYIPLFIEGCNLSLSSVKSLYHDYVKSLDFTTPDIIAAFNSGFCEFKDYPDKDLWKQSLPFVLNFNDSIVVITSYTEEESKSDLQRLCSFKRKDLNCNIMLECQVNPFSSLYPHRDWESEGVYFANKYITVIKT